VLASSWVVAVLYWRDSRSATLAKMVRACGDGRRAAVSPAPTFNEPERSMRRRSA